MLGLYTANTAPATVQAAMKSAKYKRQAAVNPIVKIVFAAAFLFKKTVIRSTCEVLYFLCLQARHNPFCQDISGLTFRSIRALM